VAQTDLPCDGLGGPPARAGTIHIVGGGPGDPGYLTLRAATVLSTCDVVAYDHLSPVEALNLVPADADRILVGRRSGAPGYSRDEVDDLLFARAAAGQAVVRLKGGDPFVFGRGGEEAEHLAEAGVPFEVVPGVTSAIAGSAVAGIPVTHRDHASSVSFVTGHEDPTKDESAVDWDALAATGGTIVVLMGVGKLPAYTAELRAAGLDGDTPVALVERATWPDMRVATGTLDTIVDVRDQNGNVPLGYQQGYIDPRGRVFEISFRKRF
jgi:uroporphyrin-III C-methyltransferase